MRKNANVTLIGSRCILVPYRAEHVTQYHEWMQSTELQEATASEPLTLEAEYEMQRTWAKDDDKCTFIVLDRSLPDTPSTGLHGGGMAGDVNLFFNDPNNAHAAEVEVMVAEPNSRRKGIAREAISLVTAYAYKHLGTKQLSAKVGESNTASLALFNDLGYTEVGRSEYFREVELLLDLEGMAGKRLLEVMGPLHFGVYDDDKGPSLGAGKP